MKLTIYITFFLITLSSYAQKVQSPDWVSDLIIYEISTKNFTSPKGPNTGTFASLEQKIPYIKELGANAIWVSGHSLADTDHFYNIWTQYACIEPDSIDPSLGTKKSFKNMIDTAHKNGIRVFLDVITHGVMKESPLVKEKPHWFEGESWGMADYDWYGNHKDLDDWWVDVWTSYSVDLGVDGYRLDVATYRPDLWYQIKKNAKIKGKDIAVFAENMNAHISPDAIDFLQRRNTLSDQTKGLNYESPILKSLGDWVDVDFEEPTVFNVKWWYADQEYVAGQSDGKGDFKVIYQGLTQDKTSRSYIPKPDGMLDYQLTITGLDKSKGEAWMYVDDNKGNKWQSNGGHDIDGHTLVKRWISDDTLEIYLSTRGPGDLYQSIQLSSHDDGWQTFPLDQNPYVVEGSRFAFGYGLLFAPAIPIFMSGEEFDSNYAAAPGHTPTLYKKEDFGKGRWLYAGVLDWNQLKISKHKEMLNDVKRMIAIRKKYNHFIKAYTINDKPEVTAVDVSYASGLVPKPYLYTNNDTYLLVAGNPTLNPQELVCNFPNNITETKVKKSYKVTNLLSGKSFQAKPGILENFKIQLQPDKSPGGGVVIYLIE